MSAVHAHRLLTALLTTGALLAVAPASAGAAAPTDPLADGQQPLSSLTPLAIMKVPQALDRAGRPLQDVPVLVADTGLDLQHPDIAPRLYSLPAAVPAPNPDGGPMQTVAAGQPGWDLIGTTMPGNLAPDPDPTDPPGGSGHGTAVAGALGAAWNNGVGGAGVAPNARFVALRTCWDNDECYQYVQAAAIDWAADRGVRVASFSWLSGPLEDGLRDAIRNHPNVLFVTIPSGNGGPYDADGDDPQPCGLDAPNVLCVTTSSPEDGFDCGAYGPHSVDVAVPTRNMATTTKGGGYATTGCATSYAAPIAAGVATILFGIDPTATPADVKAAIVDGVRTLPIWQTTTVGGGVVDADAAVRLFQQRRGIADGSVVTPPPGRVGTPGGSAPPPPRRAVDRTPPRLSLVRIRKYRHTVKVRVRASERADVKFTIERRRGKRWVATTTTWRYSLRTSGVTSYRFLQLKFATPRGAWLRHGRYRIVARVVDLAGNRGATRTLEVGRM